MKFHTCLCIFVKDTTLLLETVDISDEELKDLILFDDEVHVIVGQLVPPGQDGSHHHGQLTDPHPVIILEPAHLLQVTHEVQQSLSRICSCCWGANKKKSIFMFS